MFTPHSLANNRLPLKKRQTGVKLLFQGGSTSSRVSTLSSECEIFPLWSLLRGDMTYHVSLAGRTDDPAAIQLDQAVVVFQQSVRDLRKALFAQDKALETVSDNKPDFEYACSEIIQAILIDPRSAKLCYIKPQRMQTSVVDVELMTKLENKQYTCGNAWVLYRMLKIMFCAHASMKLVYQSVPLDSFDHLQHLDTIDQTISEMKPFVLNRIHQGVENAEHDKSDLKASSPLNRQELMTVLSRWNLFWAAGYAMTGRWKEAEDQVILCRGRANLKIAEYLEAVIHTRKADAKPSQKLFGEWHDYTKNAHKDDYHLVEAYSWLAFFIFNDSTLGTIPQAVHYLMRSDVLLQKRLSLYSFQVYPSPFMSWVTHDELKQASLKKLREHPEWDKIARLGKLSPDKINHARPKVVEKQKASQASQSHSGSSTKELKRLENVSNRLLSPVLHQCQVSAKSRDGIDSSVSNKKAGQSFKSVSNSSLRSTSVSYQSVFSPLFPQANDQALLESTGNSTAPGEGGIKSPHVAPKPKSRKRKHSNMLSVRSHFP